jgi:sigma-B regulation protein RsbU (phosphoserine phosphatase)
MSTVGIRIGLWGASAAVEELSALLVQAGHVVLRGGSGDEKGSLSGHCDVALVAAGEEWSAAYALCRRLRGVCGDDPLPVLLVLGSGAGPGERLEALRAGADAYLLYPFLPEELLAWIQAFGQQRQRQRQLREKHEEIQRINKRLQALYQQMDAELELARRLQESFLPQSLPQLPGVRLAVHYQPYGRVGGDFYDVFRLDEQHLGLYVADAMGHGIPASLLTVYLKRGVRAKEIQSTGYRLVPPSEVLDQLNRDLLEQQLAEKPFITLIYLLWCWTEGTLMFARAGHPYPLYVPAEGPATFWQLEGTLLGAFETVYPQRQEQLRPGDKLLLYTDGLDSARFGDLPPGPPSLLACAAQYRELPVQEWLARLASELFAHARPADDVTLLGLERLPT